MLGNCAMGKLRMLREPTSTKTMEITIATIGRLMKNFDMGLPSLRFHGKRLGLHLHAWTHLLYALGNHAFACFQSCRNNPLVADTVGDLNCPDVHFVLVVHDRDLIAALQFRNCTLRYKQSALLSSNHRANFAIAAGTQNIRRIGKYPGDSNRPGTLIYL